jgi:hypothetical protein
MAIPLLGFVIAQLGLRAIPVLLRSGQMAMRYLITTPGAKGKAMQELGKRVLGKNAIVDDVVKLTSKKADNIVSKIIDPKKLTASERTTLMNTTYRDSSKLLQSQKSYPSNAKLASDVEKGFGQSFSKETSGRLFIAGDRTTVAAKEVLKKTAAAPKALPKPTAAQMAKVEATEAGKIATEAAKARITAGMGITRTALKEVPKEARKQIVKLQRATKKLKTATTGVETGPVITEGLRGVGVAPKPAWWQAMVPRVLRVGGYEGPGYAGAYPAAVSGPRVGIATGGLLFGGATIDPLAKHLTKRHLAKEDILTVEQIMEAAGDTYGEAYDPNAIISKLESGDVILPEKIE